MCFCHPLDNPAWTSLGGTHARFAQRRGAAVRYEPDVSPWAAIPLATDDETAGDDAWRELAALVGPGGGALLVGDPRTPRSGWRVGQRMAGVQLDGTGMAVADDPEAVPLGIDDVPEMLDLVARAQPGPFLPRTVEMGTYLGIRRDGALVAMAGERMRPPGFAEISAVCTDDAHRGQGMGSRLVRAVGAAIRARGDVPFLHAAAANLDAVRLYQRLGFTVRRTVEFAEFRVPATEPVR